MCDLLDFRRKEAQIDHLPVHLPNKGSAMTRLTGLTRLARLISAAGVMGCLAAGTAWAQAFPPNDAGVTMGHWHLNTRDVDANKKIFVAMGGTSMKAGNFEVVRFPGVIVYLHQAAGAPPPTGGTVGTAVNHVGFIVQNTQESVAKWKAAGVPVQPGAAGRTDQAFVVTPDELRIEILEDKNQKVPIQHHHIHFWVPARTLPIAAQEPAVPLRGDAGPEIDYATARQTRRLEAVRAAGDITLDGILEEPAWTQAAIASHFIQNDPHEGQPATYDTEVRVLYDDRALYFGVFARDNEPNRIIVSDLKKDFDTTSSDGFRIILDTFRDERNGYQFATNPAGAKWDAQMTNEGRENNVNWDGIWEVATRIVATGWYAEIRIPFRTLRFNAGDGEVWGVNFERKIRRLYEDSYWAPIPRIYDIQRVSLAGTLEGMRGLRPGKDLRVKPYALSSSNTVPGRTVGDFNAGLDVKYGVTSSLTADFTLNTDFSQVEADEQQINLSRFSLFFPEKRDFFLENSGIFGFGGGGGFSSGGPAAGRQNGSQDTRLFFSRRVGLSDNGDAIPILGGARLTGRQGRYSVGALNIQQREQGSVPATNFTALRIR